MDKRQSNRTMRVPNFRLREAREQRGWAHKDVADRIGLPDSHTVGRWERGESFPQPHYRQRLTELFGKTAEELALVKIRSEEPQAPGDASASRRAPDAIWKVPRPFTSCIGREQDIATVCHLLEQPDVQLVTLLGSGGVGKTRLGIEIAYAMRQYFTGGICFVSLASISDPMLVLSTIAQTLDMQEGGQQSLAEQLKSVLGDRLFLLVLDNFEQVVTAAPLLEELLAACPGLKALVTSRSVLHLQAEREYPVVPLVTPDPSQLATAENLERYPAIALFVQRAQAILPTFQLKQSNAEAIVKICNRLDGLPLAIELAAARIKLLPPQALSAQIAQDFRLLKSDLRSQPARQQTLYNTIKWSYDLLDEQEQRFFRLLSIFSGGCTLNAAGAILKNEQTSDVLNTIASLVDNCLLHQVEQDGEMPRFTMLETVREFGLHSLQAHRELEESRDVHASYYLTLVEEARPHLNGAQQAQWLAQLEQEKENLRAALTWLIEQKETERALRFCEAFGKFCGLRGYWGEEQYWLKTALALPWPPAARAIRARVLRRAGHLAYRLRHLGLARRLFEESVALSRLEGDQQNLAGALVGLGWVLYRQHDSATASTLLHESVAAARLSGDRWALSNALESLGRLAHFQGRSDEARQLLYESVQLSRELGDKESLARFLTTLASLELAQNRIPQAALLARESFVLAQELGTKPLIALVLDSLGEVALASGEYERARQYFEERITLAQEIGDRPTIAMKQLDLAEIAVVKGDLMSATAYIGESLRFYREQNDVPNIAAALHLLGDIKRMQGRLSEATLLYNESSLLNQS